MKKMKYIITAMTGAALMFASSCTKNFEEINTNPNNPDQAPMTNVLAYTIYNLSARFGQTEMDYPAHFVGHVAKGTYTDRATLNGRPSSSVWTGGYRAISTNANFIISQAEEEGNANMQAAAMVIKSYALQMITDVYGQCPYFEAGLGSEGNVQPAFDKEEDIYDDLMEQLEVANGLFNTDIAVGGTLGEGDMLYGGEIAKWKRFCNSLHLRMAMRISNVAPAKAEAAIAKILGNPDMYPVFASNADAAGLAYPGDDDWKDPWTAYHNSIGDEKMGKPLVDSMNAFADPRLSVYADTAAGGVYVGLAIGEESAGSKAESNLGAFFIANEAATTYFMKYAEVELLKAEAYKRGFAAGDAGAAYTAAITASCAEYSIADSLVTEYLAGPKVAWADDMEQVYLQKWISLFHQSWEAWSEMRRTDIPTLGAPANTNHTGHNRPPFRFPYPETEVNNNGGNIPDAVVEDDLYWGYQTWWDVRTDVQ